jgi:hypothetical protein
VKFCFVVHNLGQLFQGWWGNRGIRLFVVPAITFSTLVTLIEFSWVVFHQTFFYTTFSDGCLGSNNDEGRSEV